MKYRVIQTIGGAMVKREYSSVDALSLRMATQGRRLIGLNNNASNRAELQGQPRYEGFAGPMWDGDAIRYEDCKSYAALSV